jgi:hypothetical protein
MDRRGARRMLVLTPTLMLVLMVSRKQETVCARPARGT